jgi:hypothetical protein
VRNTPVTGYTRISYLKFDLSAVDSISSAKLYLNGKAIQSGSLGMQVKDVTSDWDENTLTWNTRPTLGSAAIADFAPIVTGTLARDYTTSLTEWLNAQKAAGKSIVSLAVSSPTTGNTAATFGSSEAASADPYIVIN